MEKLAINESNPVDVETVKKLLKLKEEELKAMRVDFEAEAKAASEKLVASKAASTIAYAKKKAVEEFEKEMVQLRIAAGLPFDDLIDKTNLGGLQQEPHLQQQDEPVEDGNPLMGCVCVLVRTSGTVNLGQIFRSCANLGVTDIRLVAPLCEPNCAESRKYARHARNALLKAPVFATLSDAVEDCELVIGTSGRDRDTERYGEFYAPEHITQCLDKRGVPWGILPGSSEENKEEKKEKEKTEEEQDAKADQSKFLRKASKRGRYAIVFGNESHGLNGDELAQCQAFVCIPNRGYYPSYNLSQSVAICLYAVSTGIQRPEPQAPQLDPLATRGHVDTLFRYLIGTMERFGYKHLQSDARESTMQKLTVVFNSLPFTRDAINFAFSVLGSFHRHTFKDDGAHLKRETAPKREPAVLSGDFKPAPKGQAVAGGEAEDDEDN